MSIESVMKLNVLQIVTATSLTVLVHQYYFTFKINIICPEFMGYKNCPDNDCVLWPLGRVCVCVGLRSCLSSV